MSDFTEGYLVGVASIWIGFAFICVMWFLWGFFGRLWKMWRHKDYTRKHPNQPVAHVIAMVEDEHGITVTAQVDDPATFRLINNGTITGLSLDLHPNAFGQGLTFVQKSPPAPDSAAAYRETRKTIHENKEK